MMIKLYIWISHRELTMAGLTKIVRHGPLLLLNFLVVIIHLNNIYDLLILSTNLDELWPLSLLFNNERLLLLLLLLAHTVVYLILLDFLDHLIEIPNLIFIDFYLFEVNLCKVGDLERKDYDFLLTRFIIITYFSHDFLLFILILNFL